MLTLHKVNLRNVFKGNIFLSNMWKNEKKDQKPKSSKSFYKRVAVFGKKQIPVSSDCCHKTHAGRYNHMELNELYDIILLVL